MGLRFVSPNNYECHMFATAPANEEDTIHGTFLRPVALPSPSPIMFLLPATFVGITFSAYSRDLPIDDYKNLENIYFSELPLRMEGALMMMARTASWNGRQWLLILRELWRTV